MNNHLRALNILFVAALVFNGATSCAKSPIEDFQPAYRPTQEWKNSLPEEQGMDSAQLVRMFEYIEENGIPLHSLLIVRNGYLVTEVYWHPYGSYDKHSIESITKSVFGTLIGIAIDQGVLSNADQKLLDFLPQQTIQNLDGNKKSLRLHDLLSMTPGETSPSKTGLFLCKVTLCFLQEAYYHPRLAKTCPGYRAEGCWLHCPVFYFRNLAGEAQSGDLFLRYQYRLFRKRKPGGAFLFTGIMQP